MTYFYFLFILISVLFSTRFITDQFSHLVHRLGGSRKFAIYLWSFIFLPGTLIHEISHFLVAALFGARTGDISIFPEFLDTETANKKTSDHFTLGYVQVQSLNPIAGFFVGFAPFISGLILLVWLSFLIQSDFSQSNTVLLILEIYLFFTITNSFIPSRTDLKQTFPLILILSILFLLGWYFGVHFSIPFPAELISVFDSLKAALLISLIINLGISFLLFCLNYLLKFS